MAAFDGKTLAPMSAPDLPGMPGGPPLTTTAPTVPTTTTTPAAGDAGMTSTIPDVNAPDWQTQADGLKVWDVTVGDGTAVTEGSTVTAYYTGWLTDGTVFDSARSPKS